MKRSILLDYIELFFLVHHSFYNYTTEDVKKPGYPSQFLLWKTPAQCLEPTGHQTKLKVYLAAVLPILLYPCETWTVYMCHEKKAEPLPHYPSSAASRGKMSE
jgi:hypothetical protein